MFEKLLISIQNNVDNVNKMADYSRRMYRETALRRLSLIFIVLTFVVQGFAASYLPSSSTSADGTNDLINGGFNSASQAAGDCNSNLQGYSDILANYGISCKDVANASTVSLTSTDYNKKLFSMGRKPYDVAGETPVVINGTTFFVRYLWGFDTTSTPSVYPALKVTADNGLTYFLLKGCGNLVSIGIPHAVPKITITPPPVTPTCANGGLSATSLACSKPCPYDKSISIKNKQCVATCANGGLSATSATCSPCKYNKSISSKSVECQPCDNNLSSDNALACVTFDKTAENVTQGIANANNTTAQGGNVILYTIYAKNTGKAEVKKFTFQDDLSQVLDYATPTNLYGGSISNQDVISWPAVNIKSGQTLSKQFSVTVINPIPVITAASSNPSQQNDVMSNVYGNTITIDVANTPAVAAVANTATSLPNTGPGTSMFIAGAIVIVAGYFFSRARILKEESALAVQKVTYS